MRYLLPMSNRTGSVTITITKGHGSKMATLATTTVQAVLPTERPAAKHLARTVGVTLERGQVATISHPGYSFGLTPSDLS